MISEDVVEAIVLKKFIFKGKSVPFVMELPNYRMPSLQSTLQLMWEKSKDFLKKAFSVILIATIVVWILQTFDLHFNAVEDSSKSIIAAISGMLAPLLVPIGLGDWRICTALISGVMAKESVVSVMEVLFSTGGGVRAALSEAAAASLLVFSLLYTPCIASIAAIKNELGKRWAVTVVIWQCVIAWIVSFITYQIMI